MIVDRKASEEVEITSGIPQGSVLGPTFFLTDINDMAEYTNHSSVRQFADDTIVYLSSLQKTTAKISRKTFKLWRGEKLTG